ncbi:MAG TPA: FAD-dependent oxidoreductase [Acidimicrobiales bacterium]|nr:FAD-dependent oxidoreductase [Acidimicrobiales bacterium]
MQPPASLWWATLDAPVTARRALSGHHDVDVAIVGGGYTGLWTARELMRRDPSLRVAVLEQSVCGFGASGRNGGWASALFPLSHETVVGRWGLDEFSHLRHVLHESVSALGAAAAEDGIDAHFAQGGSLNFARSEVQAQRLTAEVDAAREFGIGPDDLSWLDADAARERCAPSELFGATYTPHCARIHPARLVRGLAEVVERLGVTIFEETKVTRVVVRRGRQPEVVSVGGSIHADFVVRATEGFTPTLPGQRRDVVPLYSLMIATEPLSSSFWDEVGLGHYETFNDDRHLLIYGQRTRDDRFAFGGRGSPYHFGSTVERRFDRNDRVFSMLESTLHELFPELDAAVTHRWGGPLAMPRDRTPSVTVDHATGLASAGGYSGDGVVLSYVSANALADLILDPVADTAYTRLPFVGSTSRPWPVEPLRWVGINAGLHLATWADHHERRRGTESRAGRLLTRLLG